MTLPTKYFIVLYGPTGVGKSSFALQLADKLDGEIINADMAQLYKPLSLGTAKPDWAASSIGHHLFDVIDEPVDCTVAIYRTMVQKKLNEIWARRKTPIIVGGSGFYIHSLFFAPSGAVVNESRHGEQEISWDLLNQIDPIRAQSIHPHDTYRISRALSIWRQTGKLPSQMRQTYSPLSSTFTLLYLKREREQLAELNNRRTIEMIEKGWLNECKKLIDQGWEQFVRRKKFIGYCELFDCVQGKLSLDEAIPIVQQKTRQYAKRQETFWRVFPNAFKSIGQHSSSVSGVITELNLTFNEQTLYINQLRAKLESV